MSSSISLPSTVATTENGARRSGRSLPLIPTEGISVTVGDDLNTLKGKYELTIQTLKDLTQSSSKQKKEDEEKLSALNVEIVTLSEKINRLTEEKEGVEKELDKVRGEAFIALPEKNRLALKELLNEVERDQELDTLEEAYEADIKQWESLLEELIYKNERLESSVNLTAQEIARLVFEKETAVAELTETIKGLEKKINQVTEEFTQALTENLMQAEKISSHRQELENNRNSLEKEYQSQLEQLILEKEIATQSLLNINQEKDQEIASLKLELEMIKNQLESTEIEAQKNVVIKERFQRENVALSEEVNRQKSNVESLNQFLQKLAVELGSLKVEQVRILEEKETLERQLKSVESEKSKISQEAKNNYKDYDDHINFIIETHKEELSGIKKENHDLQEAKETLTKIESVLGENPIQTFEQIQNERKALEQNLRIQNAAMQALQKEITEIRAAYEELSSEGILRHQQIQDLERMNAQLSEEGESLISLNHQAAEYGTQLLSERNQLEQIYSQSEKERQHMAVEMYHMRRENDQKLSEAAKESDVLQQRIIQINHTFTQALEDKEKEIKRLKDMVKQAADHKWDALNSQSSAPSVTSASASGWGISSLLSGISFPSIFQTATTTASVVAPSTQASATTTTYAPWEQAIINATIENQERVAQASSTSK